MTIWRKAGVEGDLNPPAQKGLGKVASLYKSHGEDVFLTAIRDGNHMDGSFHYVGLAFDFRKISEVGKSDLYKVLGQHFDIVEHSTHFHVEYDPK